MKTRKTIISILTLLLLCSINAMAQDGFRKNPYILLKENSVTIMWQLYNPQQSTFSYKKTSDNTFTNIAINENDYTANELYKYELSGLEYGTLYEFNVVLADGNVDDGSFINHPDPGTQEISFYGYGDTRGDTSVNSPPFHDQVCEKVVAEIVDDADSQTLIIHAADWNYDDTEEMWDNQYFYKADANAVELRSRIGVVGCIGNHEKDGQEEEAENYRKYWPYDYPFYSPPIDTGKFWYSFDYGPVHFCFVDQRNQYTPISEDQKDWVEDDLASSDKHWKIMVFHPPIYTKAKDPGSYNDEKAFFDEILNDPETYGVNLVIVGHVHDYSNWLVNGVHHLTLGGGGAFRAPDGEPLALDDTENPNIIGYIHDSHFAKFDVTPDYMKVTINAFDGSNWYILDEFIVPHSFIIKSGEEITWEDHGVKYYADSIRVKSGGKLTIKGEINFQRDGKIIVEPGGELIIDGALLTSIGDNYRQDGIIVPDWQGIQVWGNSSESQYTNFGFPNPQGKLIMINGATIENALIAVNLWRPEHWGTQGGMVFATDAVFRNNAKSVHALHYRNYNPYNPGMSADYRSYFKNCNFEITQAYAVVDTFFKHVDISQVDGVKFYGCSFSLAPHVEGVSEWNHAIAAYDAGFDIKPHCLSGTYPCTEYKNSTFTGFKWAISSNSAGIKPYTFTVDRAEFDNNQYGINIFDVDGLEITNSVFTSYKGVYLNGCNDAKVNLNNIYVDAMFVSKSVDGVQYPYGIYLDMCRDYQVEQNTLSSNASTPGQEGIGIVVNNRHGEASEIYNNTFDQFFVATEAVGENNSPALKRGLQFLCNRFTGNEYDIAVVPDYDNPTQVVGIARYQGKNGTSTTDPAGNLFGNSSPILDVNYQNEGNFIYYFHHKISSNPDVVPDEYSEESIWLNELDVDRTPASCPTSFGGDEVDKEVRIAALTIDAEDAKSEVIEINSQLASLVDGGNTEALENDVVLTTDADAWKKYQELMASAGYLSDEVLDEVSKKETGFSKAMIRNVLAANPQAAKSEKVQENLDLRMDPLPDYMRDQIDMGLTQMSPKEFLEFALATQKTKHDRAIVQLVQLLKSDTVNNRSTEIVSALSNTGDLAFDYKLAEYYEATGQPMLADGLLNAINGANLNENQQDFYNNYSDFRNLTAGWRQSGVDMANLDESKLMQLQDYASLNNTVAAGAIALQQLNNDYSYVEAIYFPEGGEKSNSSTRRKRTIINENKMLLFPNPADGYFTVEYQLLDAFKTAQLVIFDMQGRIISQQQVYYTIDQVIIPSQNWHAGQYTVSLMADGKTVMTKKITLSK